MPEFFYERENTYKDLRLKGRVDLNDFMKSYSHTLNDLYTAGLIKEKWCKSTAELYDFELTNIGKEFFIYHKYQIFFIRARIKPEKVHKFIIAKTRPLDGS
ncbi:MAG: hypothetical protein K9N05_02065 [Candidatus Marinimicrobia bacterium]|nr:hypothetical protein [Candidatus Neomarinimicrobiota bacterium]